jgi:hypothetical protein
LFNSDDLPPDLRAAAAITAIVLQRMEHVMAQVPGLQHGFGSLIGRDTGGLKRLCREASYVFDHSPEIRNVHLLDLHGPPGGAMWCSY